MDKPQSLSQKVVRGGLWAFSLRVLSQALGFIRTIVLARLLVPADFGLLGIALLCLTISQTFTQTGFQVALIQKKDVNKAYLNAAWTATAIRGILLSIILFCSAPLIAGILGTANEVVLIIRAISVLALLDGFRNIQTIFFQKNFEFRRYFTYELSATLSEISVTVVMAVIWQNIWALVCGAITSSLVRLIMSYVVYPERPRIEFDKEKLGELFSYGKWAVGSGILVFLVTQGDDLFVGKFLGITALGIYQIAFRISNLPATEIAYAISQVSFPAYARLQDDMAALAEAYLRVLHFTAFISAPLAGGIILFAADFTHLFLGQKWLPIVPIMQILALAGLIRSLSATSSNLFYAVGQPKIDTTLLVIRIMVLIGIIYPLTLYYEMVGVAAAVFISLVVSGFGSGIMAVKIVRCRAGDFLSRMMFSIFNTVIAMLVLLYVKPLISVGLIEFVILAMVWLSIYLLLSYLTDRLLLNGKLQLMLTDILRNMRTNNTTGAQVRGFRQA